MQDEALQIFVELADETHRPAAALKLARQLGVAEALVFVRDPDLGALLPAPGLRQTLTGGPSWRAFLRSCSSVGLHTGEVDYPTRDRFVPVEAHVGATGWALMVFGGEPRAAVLARVLELMPLLAATLRAELAISLARGEMEVAQTVGRRANQLALALDASRIELEQALAQTARLNDELLQTASKKDEFLAMLGHELRNPMAAISGAVEVMRAHPADGVKLERARDIIDRQATQLARLVDDLLDVARITRGQIPLRLEHVAVDDAVARAVESVQPLLHAKRHVVRVNVTSGLAVCADRARLQQMVANLLTNAAKYTNPDGHIDVVGTCEGDRATISVSDDGIGIAPEHLPHIFDEFMQVDPTIDRGLGGLGVGLTVVSRLAKLQQGSVTATSMVGSGSTFTLVLPVATAPPVSERKPENASSERRRVLVVDDNIDSAEMTVILMESMGHEAVHEADGPSAVDRAIAWRPDVVLLDIGLPGMDGYEVAAALRRDPMTKHARIVAVSGYGLESDRAKSRAAGCDDHLVKPVDRRALAAAVTLPDP